MHLRYVFVLLTLLGAAGTASADTWADRLFDELGHDFGVTPYGPTVTHTFTITNTTGQPLHIGAVRVSCGCVSTALQRQDLAPGEQAALIVNVDTRRFHGPTTKTVFVRFDQPQLTEVRLAIAANSRSDLTLSPATLAFGSVPSGRAAKANVTMTIADPNVNASDVKCDSGYIQPRIRLLTRTPEGASFEVSAQLGSNLPAGSWYSTVWLSTSNPAMPRIAIPVTVEVQAPAKKKNAK